MNLEFLPSDLMSLFADLHNKNENLLPYDGELYDYGVLVAGAKAEHWLAALLKQTPWQNDQVRIRGKVVTTDRQVAWYGEKALTYYYSGIARQSLPWTKNILTLKRFIEQQTPMHFNSCLLNLYHHGEEGLGWHQDNEDELVRASAIASLSFGATRRFAVRHIKTHLTREISLESGQLIVMQGTMQQHWQHTIRKETGVKTPRINLTFRQFR